MASRRERKTSEVRVRGDAWEWASAVSRERRTIWRIVELLEKWIGTI